MEVTSINGIKVENDLVRNISRVVGKKIFRYKNTSVTIIANSATHVYINFIDNIDSNRSGPMCQINIFNHGYNLISRGKCITYYKSRGFIRDRYRIYKWIGSVIRDYRREKKR